MSKPIIEISKCLNGFTSNGIIFSKPIMIIMDSTIIHIRKTSLGDWIIYEFNKYYYSPRIVMVIMQNIKGVLSFIKYHYKFDDLLELKIEILKLL